jgi:hypothetical protein
MKGAAAVIAALVLAISLPQQVFRSNIDMVAVYPLVTGPEGRFVTDLRQQDFEVFTAANPRTSRSSPGPPANQRSSARHERERRPVDARADAAVLRGCARSGRRLRIRNVPVPRSR